MERQLTSLGLFCSGEGFLIALVSKNSTFEVCSAEKTSDTLVEKIAQVLQKAKVDVSDIECLVVGVGPGSFTGSRVAVSFVKGFCCGNKNVKIVPFSTFDFLSFEKKCDTCFVPAFSNFVYAADKNGMGAITKEEAVLMAQSKKVICDKNLATKLGIDSISPNENFVAFVEHMSKCKGVDVKDLRPIYLRASQAEIEREKRLKNGSKNS